MANLTPLELEALGLSLTVALWSVIGSLPFGLGVAWLLARREFWGKTLLNGIVHLPLIIPPVAVGYFLLVALGRQGLVGAWLYETFSVTVAFTWKGAAVAAAVMAFPLMVQAIRLSLENVDKKLETTARTLGAGRVSVFLRVTLPLTAPGVLAGSVLAFARALGEFGATITFVSNIPGETRTLPIALYSVIQSPGGEDAALRLLMLSVGLAVAALAVSEFLSRRIPSPAGSEFRP